ncbi:uncharacterized protein JCM15063_002181 [Sporobolomyces koalae]|uniref:uncharacterized protein n=1 Tax=Sporobolomyces koalae TaxID=500713 RepID=UPI0031746A65
MSHGVVQTPFTSHKRRQSRSPSPPTSKRRAPPTSWSPSLFAPNRAFHFEIDNHDPAPDRSSPGLEALQRTAQHLQLDTPVAEHDRETCDEEMQLDHSSELAQPNPILPDDEDAHTLAYSPLPAMPFSRPPPPHDAPPLYRHLAGSPPPRDSHLIRLDMSRTSSSNSSCSSHVPPGFQVPPPPSGPFLDPDDHMMDPTTTSHQHHETPPPTQPTKRGWKVTMGYRPDCEKCLQRVPGHYTHVVCTS